MFIDSVGLILNLYDKTIESYNRNATVVLNFQVETVIFIYDWYIKTHIWHIKCPADELILNSGYNTQSVNQLIRIVYQVISTLNQTIYLLSFTKWSPLRSIFLSRSHF